MPKSVDRLRSRASASGSTRSACAAVRMDRTDRTARRRWRLPDGRSFANRKVVRPAPAGTTASVGSMLIRSEPRRNGQPGLPVTVGVMAKAPVAGTSKTRMCPPLSPEEAARIAEAALVDTLQAVLGTPVRRHVVVLDGDPGPW